jgi:hypothetical protein
MSLYFHISQHMLQVFNVVGRTSTDVSYGYGPGFATQPAQFDSDYWKCSIKPPPWAFWVIEYRRWSGIRINNTTCTSSRSAVWYRCASFSRIVLLWICYERVKMITSTASCVEPNLYSLDCSHRGGWVLWHSPRSPGTGTHWIWSFFPRVFIAKCTSAAAGICYMYMYRINKNVSIKNSKGIVV